MQMKYFCWCCEGFYTREMYIDHTRSCLILPSMDENNKSTCQLCKKPVEMCHEDHISKYHLFDCENCALFFSDKRQLSHHFKKVHPKEDLRKSKTRGELYPHLKDKLCCHVCGKYLSRYRLSKHVKVCNSNVKTKFKCRFCKGLFENMRELRQHAIKEHAQERKNEVLKETCQLCGKPFLNRSYLQSHMLSSHNTIRPYKCSHCTRSFKRRLEMIEHTRVHTKEKPYGCEICGEFFRVLQSKRDHYRKKHDPNYEMIACKVCNRSFDRKFNLKSHFLKMHSTDLSDDLVLTSAAEMGLVLKTDNLTSDL